MSYYISLRICLDEGLLEALAGPPEVSHTLVCQQEEDAGRRLRNGIDSTAHLSHGQNSLYQT